MTGDSDPDRRAGSAPPPLATGRAEDSHAEQVLSQALRLMAGGGAALPEEKTPSRTTGSGRRLSTGQLLLLAAIVGLLVGIGAGFLSLML